MSYRIEKGEGLAAALGRIAAEEMDLALRELRRRNHGEAVHSARKAIKRLRGLLRSVRVAFPRELFRAENQRLAKAGRKISPLRDVHVQLRTLGKLRGAGGIRRDLLRRQKSFARKIPALRRTVRRMLGGSRGMVESWPLAKTTPKILVAGLKRVYKQGRSAFKAAGKNPSPETLHEWRKQAKALGFGFELIEHLGPRDLSRRKKCCQALGGALGEDHDLFLVLETLRRANQQHPAGDYAGLARRISAKRARLEKKALKIGRAIYDDKPRAFAKRLDRCLDRAVKHKSKKK